MKNFVQDSNGIWVTDKQNLQVEYPESGSSNCKQEEDSGSFWFSHRNDIIYETVKQFPFGANFADVGGGNGFQVLDMQQRIPGPQYYLIEPGYNACLIAHKRGL